MPFLKTISQVFDSDELIRGLKLCIFVLFPSLFIGCFVIIFQSSNLNFKVYHTEGRRVLRFMEYRGLPPIEAPLVRGETEDSRTTSYLG